MKNIIFNFFKIFFKIFKMLFWFIFLSIICCGTIDSYFLIKNCDNIAKLDKVFFVIKTVILFYLIYCSFKAENKHIKYLIAILWVLVSLDFEVQEASYICQRDIIGFFD